VVVHEDGRVRLAVRECGMCSHWIVKFSWRDGEGWRTYDDKHQPHVVNEGDARAVAAHVVREGIAMPGKHLDMVLLKRQDALLEAARSARSPMTSAEVATDLLRLPQLARNGCRG
jgi:hypothetical protein